MSCGGRARALLLSISVVSLTCATSSTTAVAAPRRAESHDRDRDRDRDGDRDRSPKRAKPKRPVHGPVEIPIDVGVGPVALLPNPPMLFEQPVYAGVALSLAAVIDEELIRENRDKIPVGMRALARNVSEVRLRPWYLALVPELIVVSPQVLHTGMYGAVWRPIGAGITFLEEPVRIAANANLDVAYLFVHSDTLGGGTASAQSFTHFVRPGINLELVAEVPITDSFLISGGWSSDLFVPQPIGRPPWEVFPLDEALWHLGGPFLMLHVRIPYTVQL